VGKGGTEEGATETGRGEKGILGDEEMSALGDGRRVRRGKGWGGGD
jgi:hypothetical protein